MIRILHTSDWHIGRVLYNRKRYAEFEAFLDWMVETLQQHEVDVLLVAGDVFDTSAPSNRAQELYYRFLCRVAGSRCRHVVVVAGNHDSPSFLAAPKELLRVLDVHVVGNLPEDPADEVLVLPGPSGMPEVIVCAIPYLRDRDIRTAEAGETMEDKERKLLAGIRDHYATVVDLALQRREQIGLAIPIVATGHLFAAGGELTDGDGVRDLYVGSLAHMTVGAFPDKIDYLALGHLHVPQVVGGQERIRYSGSPLPMGFGEARQQKRVYLADFDHTLTGVQPVDIPVFQPLEQIRGNLDHIGSRLGELVGAGSTAWLEIIYDGEEIVGDLREQLDRSVEGSALEILRVKNARVVDRAMEQLHDGDILHELDVAEVFQRCLADHKVPEEQHAGLLHAYQEIMASLQTDDMRAE